MSISWRILIKYMTILLRSRFNEYKVFYSTPMTVVNEHIKKIICLGVWYHRSFLSWFFHGKLTNCIKMVNKTYVGFLNFLKFFLSIITSHPLLPPQGKVYWFFFFFWSILLHISECISVYVILVEINIRINTDTAKPEYAYIYI